MTGHCTELGGLEFVRENKELQPLNRNDCLKKLGSMVSGEVVRFGVAVNDEWAFSILTKKGKKLLDETNVNANEYRILISITKENPGVKEGYIVRTK